MESYVKPNSIRNKNSPDFEQDIDANFDAIFKAVKALRARLDDLESVTGIEGPEGKQGPPGRDGEDGEDGSAGPPGTIGVDGAAGATGPAGPTTMGLTGDDGEEAFPIPGPQGPQGNPGATGAQGPQAMFMWLEDGEPGEDGIHGRNGVDGEDGAGGGAWTLIEARTCTGQPQEDFINLSSYSAILVMCRAVTKSVSGILSLRVSKDNGSTFLSASGDYVSIATTGVETNGTSLNIHATSTTAARSGFCTIEGFNISGTVKASYNISNVTNFFATDTDAYDAIRVFPSGGGNLNAGTIYVLGR